MLFEGWAEDYDVIHIRQRVFLVQCNNTVNEALHDGQCVGETKVHRASDKVHLP